MDLTAIFLNLISWFWIHGVARAAGILFVAFLTNLFLQLFVGRAIRKQIESRFNGRRKKRAETLISVFGGTMRFVIYNLWQKTAGVSRRMNASPKRA